MYIFDHVNKGDQGNTSYKEKKLFASLKQEHVWHIEDHM